MDLISGGVRRTMFDDLIVNSWISDLKVMDLISRSCTFGMRLDDMCV